MKLAKPPTTSAAEVPSVYSAEVQSRSSVIGRRKTPAMLLPTPIEMNWPTTAPMTIHQPQKMAGRLRTEGALGPQFMQAW